MTRNSCRAFWGVAASALLFVPLALAQNVSPDLKNGKIKVHSVLIIPPQVSFEKTGFKSTQPEMERARNIENTIFSGIQDVLNDDRCKIASNPFTATALDADSDMKYSLADAQRQFDSINLEMQKKQKDVRKGRFTLGDAVNKVNVYADSDALIFARGSGRELTSGVIATEIIAGFGPSAYFHLQIAVVDSHTGNVLYYGEGNVQGSYSRSIRRLLKNFSCSALTGIESPPPAGIHP